MMRRPKPQRRRRDQQGAALIVALFMVATLAFVSISIAERTTFAVRRTANSAARNALYWRLMSAEILAEAAIERSLAESEGARSSPQNPLFLAPFDIPLPEGLATFRFRDASNCFNVNSLVTSEDEGDRSRFGDGESGDSDELAPPPNPTEEFAALAQAFGVPNGEAERLAGVIKDWIDPDTFQEFGGAEDSFYTGLPTPFRTGATGLADVSELRAMEGFNRDVYRAFSPMLCARLDVSPSKLNVNLLRGAPIGDIIVNDEDDAAEALAKRGDAPLLVAVTGGALSVEEANRIIADRPPGGWETATAFWASPALANIGLPSEYQNERIGVASEYVEALGTITINDVDMDVRLLFKANPSGGDVNLVSREFGTAQ